MQDKKYVNMAQKAKILLKNGVEFSKKVSSILGLTYETPYS